MKTKKLKYLGTAPGQAGSVSYAGHRFVRGETYELDADFADILLAKGGFDVVKPATKKESKAIEEIES